MLKYFKFSLIWLILAAMAAAGCGAFTPVPAPTTEMTVRSDAAPPAIKPAQSQPALSRPAGVPVLMYHKIGSEAGNDAVISEGRFKEHMAYLHKNGYNPISLDELYGYLAGTQGLPPKPVVITFDDGYHDTYTIAYPVLKQYGFKSTLFFIAGWAGKELTWDQLREMKAGGMAIESHTVTHRSLGELSSAVQSEEMAKSKAILDKELNQNTRFFCYPNSSYNADSVKLLPEKGYVLAVTTEPGWAKSADNIFVLKRIWVGNQVDTKILEERLTKENYSIL